MTSNPARRRLAWASVLVLLAALMASGAYALGPRAQLGAAEVNPCGAKAKTLNPCDARTLNPCNPCGGARVDAKKFVQGSRKLSSQADPKLGEALWNDRSLGKSGLACSSCHIDHYAQMNPTFAKPYPHRVAMPHQQGGVDQVNAAEMVQFCMLVPMMAEPLPWDSRELASLASYVESIQSGYRPVTGGSANPCNPCGTKNPCNPCGTKNPCNPCSK